MLSPLRKASKSNVNGPIDRYMTHYALYPRFISWCRFRCALWTEQIGVASVLPAYHCVRKSTGKANREVTWLIQAIWNKSCLKTHTRFSSEYHTLAVCNNFEGKMYLPTIFQSNVESTLCSPHENSQKCSCLQNVDVLLCGLHKFKARMFWSIRLVGLIFPSGPAVSLTLSCYCFVVILFVLCFPLGSQWNSISALVLKEKGRYLKSGFYVVYRRQHLSEMIVEFNMTTLLGNPKLTLEIITLKRFWT